MPGGVGGAFWSSLESVGGRGHGINGIGGAFIGLGEVAAGNVFACWIVGWGGGGDRLRWGPGGADLAVCSAGIFGVQYCTVLYCIGITRTML